MDGKYYFDIVRAIKSKLPEMHIHAFSPFEIWYGSSKTRMSYSSFLSELKKMGLGSIPGTAAEILDTEIRKKLTKNKLSAEKWVEIIKTAHEVGLQSSATIMYGHIDRISSGQVGSLMDRFSDRFGSELDREIIVLRKKQQQDLLAIKPTVELISSPDDVLEQESGDQVKEIEEDSADLFPQFFEIVNNLLGDKDDDFINSFVSSDDFPLFQEVGEDPTECDDETKSEFFSMINRVLGELPEEKIGDFVASPGFAIYQEMGEIYS